MARVCTLCPGERERDREIEKKGKREAERGIRREIEIQREREEFMKEKGRDLDSEK